LFTLAVMLFCVTEPQQRNNVITTWSKIGEEFRLFSTWHDGEFRRSGRKVRYMEENTKPETSKM